MPPNKDIADALSALAAEVHGLRADLAEHFRVVAADARAAQRWTYLVMLVSLLALAGIAGVTVTLKAPGIEASGSKLEKQP